MLYSETLTYEKEKRKQMERKGSQYLCLIPRCSDGRHLCQTPSRMVLHLIFSLSRFSETGIHALLEHRTCQVRQENCFTDPDLGVRELPFFPTTQVQFPASGDSTLL